MAYIVRLWSKVMGLVLISVHDDPLHVTVMAVSHILALKMVRPSLYRGIFAKVMTMGKTQT